MKITMTININDKVRVTLTRVGWVIYEDYVKKFSTHTLSEMYKVQEAKAGKPVEFQLWEFMNIFGRNMYGGAENVIVNNTLEIVTN